MSVSGRPGGERLCHQGGRDFFLNNFFYTFSCLKVLHVAGALGLLSADLKMPLEPSYIAIKMYSFDLKNMKNK